MQHQNITLPTDNLEEKSSTKNNDIESVEISTNNNSEEIPEDRRGLNPNHKWNCNYY